MGLIFCFVNLKRVPDIYYNNLKIRIHALFPVIKSGVSLTAMLATSCSQFNIMTYIANGNINSTVFGRQHILINLPLNELL